MAVGFIMNVGTLRLQVVMEYRSNSDSPTEVLNRRGSAPLPSRGGVSAQAGIAQLTIILEESLILHKKLHKQPASPHVCSFCST